MLTDLRNLKGDLETKNSPPSRLIIRQIKRYKRVALAILSAAILAIAAFAYLLFRVTPTP